MVHAGLRLAPGAVRLTRAWIVYNKPATPTYSHAGLLMGLGLSGALLVAPTLLCACSHLCLQVLGILSMLRIHHEQHKPCCC